MGLWNKIKSRIVGSEKAQSILSVFSSAYSLVLRDLDETSYHNYLNKRIDSPAEQRVLYCTPVSDAPAVDYRNQPVHKCSVEDTFETRRILRNRRFAFGFP